MAGDMEVWGWMGLAVTQLGKCRASGHGLRTQADLECKDLVISWMGKRAMSVWGKPSVCVEFNAFFLCKCAERI